jgi:hypothetical protein
MKSIVFASKRQTKAIFTHFDSKALNLVGKLSAAVTGDQDPRHIEYGLRRNLYKPYDGTPDQGREPPSLR